MATNPMQRKSRNSFLLGMLTMLLVAAVIVALLFVQLLNLKKKEKEQIQNSVKVYVLKKDIASGQTITEDMLEMKTIDKTTVPNNAFSDISIFSNYTLADTQGNQLKTDGNGNLYINGENNQNVAVTQDPNTGAYYKEVNGQKTEVVLSEVPLVAKVAMKKNTVLTLELVSKSNERTTDDLRQQEYNMLVLPTTLEEGDYVDVRLRLPSGEDYIVVAKKSVTLVTDNSGVTDESILQMNLKEEEILAMSNAIVEAYQMTGSMLYVDKYTEPGLQAAATPTYAPKKEVLDLIVSNPNIVQSAKDELYRRYNNGGTNQRNGSINSALSQYAENAKENIESGVEEEARKANEARKRLLDSLSGVSE